MGAGIDPLPLGGMKALQYVLFPLILFALSFISGMLGLGVAFVLPIFIWLVQRVLERLGI